MAAVFSAALASTKPAHASFLFTSSDFGVGATCGGNINPATGLNFTSGSSSINLNCSGAFSSGTLTANFGPGTVPTMGIQLTDNGVPANGNLLIADGFNIIGAGATANFTITGAFTGGHVDTTFEIGVASYANFANNTGLTNYFLFAANGVPLGNGTSQVQFAACNVNGCGAFSPWTGSATLNLPVASTDNGFILEADGNASGNPGASTDFLHTITVGFTPANGGSVTLVTGQTFGGSPVTTPEPSSLLLVATGLLGLAGVAGRKKLFA